MDNQKVFLVEYFLLFVVLGQIQLRIKFKFERKGCRVLFLGKRLILLGCVKVKDVCKIQYIGGEGNVIFRYGMEIWNRLNLLYMVVNEEFFIFYLRELVFFCIKVCQLCFCGSYFVKECLFFF